MIYENLFTDIKSQKDFNRYKKFIESRENRVLLSDKVHRHHIFPRSYCKKDLEYLATDKDNLILLSAREHYIAHLILWKALGGKMELAFWYMTNIKKFGVRLTSKQYEKLSLEESERQSKRMSGKNHPGYGKHQSEETKRKISETETGKTISEESRRKMSEYRTGRKMPIFSEMYSGEGNPFYGKTHTEEVRRKISEANHGSLESRVGKEKAVEIKKKMSEARKGKTYEEIYGVEKSKEIKEKFHNSMIGFKHSEETKRRMSEADKNRPPVTEETRQKRSESLKGKKRTEESKKKYSEAAKKREWKECPICGRYIDNPNFERHQRACKRNHENPKVKTRKGSTTGRIWISKELERKLINRDELDNYIANDWKLGQNKVYKKNEGQRAIMRILEALTKDDEREILDIESDILDLKRNLIDASKEEKESIKIEIDELKQKIADIKERGKENEDA